MKFYTIWKANNTPALLRKIVKVKSDIDDLSTIVIRRLLPVSCKI
jgi:hypothetical protein